MCQVCVLLLSVICHAFICVAIIYDVPYMNSRLRHAIHKKNMMHNAYRKGKVKWDDYRKQRNLTTAINKQSKLTYFRERRDGGPKKSIFLEDH